LILLNTGGVIEEQALGNLGTFYRIKNLVVRSIADLLVTFCQD
jgi:hypothetical protein